MSFEQTSNPEYSGFIHLSRYARFDYDEGRRETWEETVDRYISFFLDKTKDIDFKPLRWDEEFHNLRNTILNLEVMPSMRCFMTAGKALERDNVSGYNCAYLIINRQRAFDELMYILLCGTGVGFSCERDEVKKLPDVAETMHETDTTIMVSDSKIGWASAFRELLSLLYSGKVPKWNMSRVRPAGAALKTFGGRASGPKPLDDLFQYSCNLFTSATGRKLNSLEVHGLVCKIAEVVVVGGVRRSALISLSSFSDDRLRHAKSGQWHVSNPEYALANNSVAYTEKPNSEAFIREWLALVESKSGERGVFNREASRRQASKNKRRDSDHAFGTNPCSEIILRDRQLCNLSEVVVRSTDTFDELKRKVRLAAILGTLQSTLTNFRYLSKAWQNNTEEERLLGVSLTGIMDHPVLSGSTLLADWFGPYRGKPALLLESTLTELKEVAIETNKEWADRLGIPQSTAVTCVKPSGTVSQLVDSSSGIHPRHSPFYIRTVRADKKDPLAQMMMDQGFPVEDDITKPDTTCIFSFPMKSSDGSLFRDDRTAIEQLDLWGVYQEYWCDHKPSITVYVKDEEWLEVGAWVYKNFDTVSGISFLPHDGGNYKQAPYQEITEEGYHIALEAMPKNVDWSKLSEYEQQDNTVGSQSYACSSGLCEVVDLV